MSSIATLGKCLDQPILVSSFSKAVPKVLIGGGITYGLHNTRKAPKQEKKKTFTKNVFVIGMTIASALISTRGIKPFKIGNKVFKGFSGLSESKDLSTVIKNQTKVINDFIDNNAVNQDLQPILNTAKTRVLNTNEIEILYNELGESEAGKKFLSKLIPDPENITSKDIFGEIKRLSLIGLVPVLGGITGGVMGDIATEKNWKNRVPNKIKEGFYQYFANIFLCNVGAGAALGIMEKMNVKSKSQRALGMIAGIMTTGVIGGSAIANYLGKKLINPIFNKQCKRNKCNNIKELYSERKPEALDVGLHVDDIATVAVMSGLKWIEPTLPLLYSISGYRAGIGYRNGNDINCINEQRCFKQQYYSKKNFNQKRLKHGYNHNIFNGFLTTQNRITQQKDIV